MLTVLQDILLPKILSGIFVVRPWRHDIKTIYRPRRDRSHLNELLPHSLPLSVKDPGLDGLALGQQVEDWAPPAIR
jgi:hypothetical protein